ncbi:hypothetical protein [Yoonia vestfoldensis]|uniref:Uncharacterized protein n=1 Tax=Yoonia vestfoldensis TaxID=245188 RepID=A0A1Y0EHM2_9RHOB|nr:hypothetical protein [Yoonia vestfoldensis]ARU03126.1 hypothetical protein LOKVESSMR4R_03861 [Yoonia vestfoldensis]
MTEYRHQPLRKADVFELVSTWASDWWALDDAGAVLTPDVLPDEGVITFLDDEPVVVSFIYDVASSAISLHAYLLASPSLDAVARGQAVQAHIPAAVMRSEELGNSYQMWICDHPKLTASLQRDHGFHEGFTSCAAVYRTSAGAQRLAALDP